MPTARKTDAEQAEEIMDRRVPEREAEANDFLSQLEGDEDEGDEGGEVGEVDQEERPAAKPRGKPTKGAAKAEDPFEDAYDDEIPEDAGDGDPEGEGEEQDESDDEEKGTAADRAVKALRLDGWTEAQIKALPKSVLLEVGETRARAHAKADRSVAGQGSGKAQGQVDSKAGAKQATEALIDKLSGMMAVPQHTAKAALKELVEAITAPYEDVRTSMVRVEANQARGRLQEKFPQLKVPKEFGATFTEAQRLMTVDPERYSSVGRALHAAATLRYADGLLDGADARDRNERRARSAGVPTNTSKQGGAPARETRDQLESRWLDEGFKGNRQERDRIGARLAKPRR